jgi:hypothetical protein
MISEKLRRGIKVIADINGLRDRAVSHHGLYRCPRLHRCGPPFLQVHWTVVEDDMVLEFVFPGDCL